MSLQPALACGLGALGVELDASTQGKLVDYVHLIDKWNRVHNLTAIREPDQMVGLHLLDSLSLLGHLGAGESLVDVGSGAGLPGLALALARPDLAVTVLDSSHKKAAFLDQAKAQLGLANVEVVCARVEQWRPGRAFSTVVSRAFAELADFVALAGHLLAPGGSMLAMKGLYPHEEAARLPKTHRVDRVVAVRVPGVDAERHLVFMSPA